jgi:addiction module HigA family antidote
MKDATQREGRLIPTHRPPTSPGEMLLEEFLKPAGISLNAFAKTIGVTYARLHEMTSGKRALTPDTAQRLAQATGWSAATWMEFQYAVDQYELQQKPVPAAIKKIKRVPAFSGAA